MALQHGKRTWQAIELSVVISMILCMAGCKTTEPVRVQGEIVGGGLKIEWTAPVNGTVYLVEEKTNRIMETRSLKQGDTYSFSPTSESQRGEFERILGIKLSDARFLLYFQPASPQNAAQ
jgi:hypothetical protein